MAHTKSPDRRETITWQTRLDRASSEREVVSISRDFMAQFSPNEIASIPENCRPGKITDASDITSVAFELARDDCHGDGESVIAKVGVFFASASDKLSRLLASNDGNGDSRQSA